MYQHQFKILDHNLAFIRYIYIVCDTRYYVDAWNKFSVFLTFHHPHLSVKQSTYIGCTDINISRTPEIDDVDEFIQFNFGNA